MVMDHRTHEIGECFFLIPLNRVLKHMCLEVYPSTVSAPNRVGGGPRKLHTTLEPNRKAGKTTGYNFFGCAQAPIVPLSPMPA
jgi:hypothetical protein